MSLIYFKNPKFNKGLNFTVRKGENWKKRVAIGDVSKISGCDLPYLQKRIIIEKIYVCKFKNIPKEVYEKEHDKKCRTKKGLAKVLSEVYNVPIYYPMAWKNVVVTCLGFRILKGGNENGIN